MGVEERGCKANLIGRVGRSAGLRCPVCLGPLDRIPWHFDLRVYARVPPVACAFGVGC
jgi:hypothetical protein